MVQLWTEYVTLLFFVICMDVFKKLELIRMFQFKKPEIKGERISQTGNAAYVTSSISFNLVIMKTKTKRPREQKVAEIFFPNKNCVDVVLIYIIQSFTLWY